MDMRKFVKRVLSREERTTWHPDTVLLFVGAPRTGSTFLGQILNYHPNCLIANEYRFLNRVIDQGMDYDRALQSLAETALRHFRTGLEGDAKFARTLMRSQPRWQPLNDLCEDVEFKKREIKVVGDKKAGGNTLVFMQKPDAVARLVEKRTEIRLLHLLRNPLDAAFSLMKSHNVDSFEMACERIVRQSHVAFGLVQRYPARSKVVYYDDLMSEPTAVLYDILSWLGVESSSAWLSKIAERVSPHPDMPANDKYLSTARAIVSKHEAWHEFERYNLGRSGS